MKQFKAIRENYAQDLDLAQKNVARLSKKETGQDQKDYQAVARALNQGNLGAVKRVIKSISTKEIQADILNILVGYNDLIAQMYPKAVDSKGNLKSGLSVDKMIKEETVSEGKKIQDIVRKHKRELQKVQKSGNLELSKKAEDELSNWASSNGEIRGDDEDEFIEWLDNNLDDLIKGKIKEDVNEAKPPKIKGLSIYGSEISGLRRSHGSKLGTYTAKPVVLKGKLGYRVTDDNGGFETLDLKTFAKMYG